MSASAAGPWAQVEVSRVHASRSLQHLATWLPKFRGKLSLGALFLWFFLPLRVHLYSSVFTRQPYIQLEPLLFYPSSLTLQAPSSPAPFSSICGFSPCSRSPRCLSFCTSDHILLLSSRDSFRYCSFIFRAILLAFPWFTGISQQPCRRRSFQLFPQHGHRHPSASLPMPCGT